MSGQHQIKGRIERPNTSEGNVIHIYQVRPEMALEHLRRSTGLDFASMPENLVEEMDSEALTAATNLSDAEPPLLTDIVDFG